MKNVKRNQYFLNAYLHATPKQRRLLVEDRELAAFFKSCCRNFLAGNLTKNPRIIAKLSKYKKLIRQLSHGKQVHKRDKTILKRQAASQSGGIGHIYICFICR